MTELVADCPRCGASQISFDVTQSHIIGFKYRWQTWYECFAICRHCRHATTFVLSEKTSGDADRLGRHGGILQVQQALNHYLDIEGYVSLKDYAGREPPDHLPEYIEKLFREGVACLAVGCYNAAGMMFRLCVDIVTQDRLPDGEANGLNQRVRRNLGLRLPWMFDNGILPEALRDLATCIKDDGNDAAHRGTLTKDDAEDLLDFAFVLFERLYTEPARLEHARERRRERRTGNAPAE